MPPIRPCDASFGSVLESYNILLPSYKAENKYCGLRGVDADRVRLQQPRPAAENVHCTAEDFIRFREESNNPTEEGLARSIFQTIKGPPIYKSVDNFDCQNFVSMTSNEATKPKPDYLEGATVTDVHPVIQRELKSVITPSVYGFPDKNPIAPNLAVELKSTTGDIRTAQFQVSQDGAYCARALHALDHWRRAADDPSPYDGKAYGYSATYLDGTGFLQMYSHHVEVMANGQQRYHIVTLDTAYLLHSRKELLKGITAFRNLKDMAAERRNAIIYGANARVE